MSNLQSFKINTMNKIVTLILLFGSFLTAFSQSIQNDWLEIKENLVSIDLWRYFEVNNVNENGDSIGDVELWRLGKILQILE